MVRCSCSGVENLCYGAKITPKSSGPLAFTTHPSPSPIDRHVAYKLLSLDLQIGHGHPSSYCSKWADYWGKDTPILTKQLNSQSIRSISLYWHQLITGELQHIVNSILMS